LSIFQRAFQLPRFNCFENFAKFRTRLHSHRNEIVPANQRRWNDWFVREFLPLSQKKLVVVQHPMAARAIDSM
jgi:hypothetical protein